MVFKKIDMLTTLDTCHPFKTPKSTHESTPELRFIPVIIMVKGSSCNIIIAFAEGETFKNEKQYGKIVSLYRRNTFNIIMDNVFVVMTY